MTISILNCMIAKCNIKLSKTLISWKLISPLKKYIILLKIRYENDKIYTLYVNIGG